MKLFAAGFLTCYLLAGMLLATSMKTVVPATNMYCGVPYLVVIWPAWVGQVIFSYDIGFTVPSCSFTFKEKP